MVLQRKKQKKKKNENALLVFFLLCTYFQVFLSTSSFVTSPSCNRLTWCCRREIDREVLD